MSHKKIYWAIGIGFVAGFYLAGANSTQGIFGTYPIVGTYFGKALGNLYVSGNNAAGGNLTPNA